MLLTQHWQEVVTVKVRKSKTDQERKGHTRTLAGHSVSAENEVGSCSPIGLCAVCWIRRYRKMKSTVVKTPGNTSARLFVKSDITSLSNTTINGRVQHWVRKIGEKDYEAYGSRSLRRGGATAATQSGVNIEDVKQQGNWKSDCVYEYTSLSIDQKVAVTSF